MRFSISMTDTFYNRLKLKADKAGMGLSEYIRYAVNRLWEREA